MPELPEVETTRRGLAPHVRRRRIAALAGLRAAPALAGRRAICRPSVAGQRIVRVGRRAQVPAARSSSSGHCCCTSACPATCGLVPAATARLHARSFRPGAGLRLCAALQRSATLRQPPLHPGGPARHPLLERSRPRAFRGGVRCATTSSASRARRRVAIKQLLMNSRLVVGVGNIYASEALFRARIAPAAAGRVPCHARMPRGWCARCARCCAQAIRAGGTTLRDYLGADGAPGYFRQRLYVYERRGKPCRRCGTPVRAHDPGTALHVLLPRVPEVDRMSDTSSPTSRAPIRSWPG